MVQAVVDVKDLMEHLKTNNLVIVHKDDLRIKELLEERNLLKKQKELLKQAAIKPGEAIKYKLVKDVKAQGLRGWVEKHYPEALLKDDNGHFSIVTYAIIERRKTQNLH